MTGYEVVINVMVKEVYYVDAESEQEARETWHNTEPQSSEAIYVDDISVSEVEDD